MSQNTFIPTGSETHLDARDVWNGNAADAESRLTALESGKEIITPQVVTSSGGLLTWDHNLGSTIKVNLTEDVTSVSISNAVEGDSGMIVVRQGGVSPFAFGGSSLRTLSGDLSVIASDMPAASYVCTINWYYDGSLIYVYVSDTSITSL